MRLCEDPSEIKPELPLGAIFACISYSITVTYPVYMVIIYFSFFR